MARVLSGLGIVQVASWLLASAPGFPVIAFYLPLHTLLESISIYVSMMVFTVGWRPHAREPSGNIIVLACVFFFVGLLDFSHTASYGGMPDYLSPNDAQKHLYFWLAARLLAALALLAIVLRPWKPLAHKATRYVLFAVLLALTALTHWIVIVHQAWLPEAFIAGQGLTAFKKNIEYVVIAINLGTAALLLRRLRDPQPFRVVLLLGATCTLAMSEIYFTLYTTMTGSYNVLGHVYKVIAYFFIYRAVVSEVFEEPYRRLDILTQEQNAILSSRIVGIVKLQDQFCVWANEAFAALLGYQRQEIIGRPARMVHTSDEAYAAFARDANPVIQRGEVFRGEIQCRRKDGTLVWFEVSGAHGGLASGESIWAIVDVTERKELEAQIRELAYFDPLTKLPNRRILDDRLTLAIAGSRRSGQYGALLFVDLDNFKPLNDKYGHAMGDLLLVEVARRIRGCVREIDTVARFGGDEFEVLLSELGDSRTTAHTYALTIAEKARAALAQPYVLDGTGDGAGQVVHRCTASIGVLLFLASQYPANEMHKLVDRAMYQAKQAGRNAVRFFEA